MRGAFSLQVAPGGAAIDRADRALLKRLAGRVMAWLPLPGMVHLVVIDDATMRALNARYRGLHRTTDVLSFDLTGDPAGPGIGEALTGEIYVSLDRARVQAAEQGATLREELGRLLVHGLLHLAGREHRTTAQRREMEADTERFLAAVGLSEAPRHPETALAGSVARKG